MMVDEPDLLLAKDIIDSLRLKVLENVLRSARQGYLTRDVPTTISIYYHRAKLVCRKKVNSGKLGVSSSNIDTSKF